jgi:hypothetical protein
MKTSFSLGLAVTAGMFALMTAPQAAHAANFNIPGSTCRAYNPPEDIYIHPLVNGVENTDSAAAHNIICPIAHAPATASSPISIYVDGYSASGYPIACVLYSYSYYGSLVGSYSMAGRTGQFDTAINTAGNQWSTATLYCTLPPRGLGYIYDIDVVQ